MMTTISTAGEILHSLFIWRGKVVQLESENDLPPHVLVSASPKGFMTGEIFAKQISIVIETAKVSPESSSYDCRCSPK